MGISLAASYRHCGRIALAAASSFYWSFWLLPRAKRMAMCALYAYSRHTDDLGDSDQPAEIRLQRLYQWRHAVEQSFAGRFDDPLLPALVHTVRRFNIPAEHVFEVIDGVEMDLRRNRFETFEQLRGYCYRVASAVGLACVHIWGFRDDGFREPAIRCGVAFQLTNILRDLKEDAARNRVYLPLEDLRRFEYSVDELKQGVYDRRFAELMKFEIRRAEQFYREAAPLARHLHADGQRALQLMTSTYWQLLVEIGRRSPEVFQRGVRLRRRQKLAIAISALLGTGGSIPSRGLSVAHLNNP